MQLIEENNLAYKKFQQIEQELKNCIEIINKEPGVMSFESESSDEDDLNVNAIKERPKSFTGPKFLQKGYSQPPANIVGDDSEGESFYDAFEEEMPITRKREFSFGNKNHKTENKNPFNMNSPEIKKMNLDAGFSSTKIRSSDSESHLVSDLTHRLQQLQRIAQDYNMKPNVSTISENRTADFEKDFVSRSKNFTLGGKTVRRISTVKNIPKVSNNSIISVCFGHENWNLVLNMMIGIRNAVKSTYRTIEVQGLKEYDFCMKGVFDLVPKRVKAFDKRKKCRFYDYSPLVFEKIRLKFGITNEKYLKSMGPEQMLSSLILGNLASLTELCSAGKSGSFFYFSPDSLLFILISGKFLLKTISRNEFVFLRKLIKPYYEYISQNEKILMSM